MNMLYKSKCLILQIFSLIRELFNSYSRIILPTTALNLNLAPWQPKNSYVCFDFSLIWLLTDEVSWL